MPWYFRVQAAINSALPELILTQKINLLPKSRLRDPRRRFPEEPWYLATSLEDPRSAANWYWQRGWIERPFKDAKGRFGLARVQTFS